MYRKIVRESVLVFILVLIIGFAVSIYIAPCAPAKFPMHWNINGQIDGWGSKLFTVLFFPILAFVMYILLTFLPLTDPFKKNYKDFEIPYYFVKLWFLIFTAVLFFITALSGWGLNVTPVPYIIILLSLFLIMLGFYMPKIKQNFYFGIRTPWTITSESNWQKTHKLAGKTMLAGGVLALFSLLFPIKISFWFFMSIILLSTLSPVIYSYLIFVKDKKVN